MIGELVKVGKTKKPHGTNGELKLHIHEEFENDFNNAKVIFLGVGAPTPFFVESIRGELFPILKLEDIDDRTRAFDHANKEIFLRKEDIAEKQEEVSDLEYFYLKGFSIIDETVGNIGEIIDVIEMPQQEMAVLKIKKREVLIPLNENLIVKIRKEKKEVKMDLPEGLVEL